MANTVKVEIKNRWTDAVLYTAELPADMESGLHMRAALEQATAADANLAGANLADANLAGANLARANLAGANLADANLADANLAGANLADANLAHAYLAGANLAGANLADANLADAYLAHANLAGANLAGANLAGANLADAYLAGANLADAKCSDLVIAQTRILPDGELVGWKKCKDGVLVKLRIPLDAKRSHAFGRKCRAEFADCIEVIGAESGVSQHDKRTVYRAGERVICDVWDADWTNECSGGIHFFITRAEAEAWR
jgi:uncharacterized protein YjbI with pentapeptide repeats